MSEERYGWEDSLEKIRRIGERIDEMGEDIRFLMRKIFAVDAALDRLNIREAKEQTAAAMAYLRARYPEEAKKEEGP